jgi:hypothetical protein
MEKKSIVQWCKEQHDQNGELCLVWDGGGDSGWAYFEIDGETIENDYTNCLVNRIYDVLDYGSWAGEFQASGKAIYDPKTNSFEGIDYYGEDDHDVLDIDIKVKVPKSLWFDTLHIECDANYDDDPTISVQLLLKNGFLTDQHTEFCSNLENVIQPQFSSIFTNYNSADGYEFRACNDSWILERKDAVEEGDMLVFTMNKIDLQILNSEEKSIVLTLDEETAAAIDEQLNDVEHAD